MTEAGGGVLRSQPLNRAQMEIYLTLLHETMNVAEMLTAQLRAIEIVAAHEKLAANNGRRK